MSVHFNRIHLAVHIYFIYSGKDDEVCHNKNYSITKLINIISDKSC